MRLVQDIPDLAIEHKLVVRVLLQAALLFENHLDLPPGACALETPEVAAFGQREASLHVLGPHLEEEAPARLLRRLRDIHSVGVRDHWRVQIRIVEVQQIRKHPNDLQSDAVGGPVVLEPDLLAWRRAELQDHRRGLFQLQGGEAHRGAIHDRGVGDGQQAHLFDVVHDPRCLGPAVTPADFHVGPGLLPSDLLLRYADGVMRPQAADANAGGIVPVHAGKDDIELRRRRRPTDLDPRHLGAPRDGPDPVRRGIRRGRLEVLVVDILERENAFERVDRLHCAHGVAGQAKDVVAQGDLVIVLKLVVLLEYDLRLESTDHRHTYDVIPLRVAEVPVEDRMVGCPDLCLEVPRVGPVVQRDLLAIQGAPRFQEGVSVRCPVRIVDVVAALP
mmetsp:Transcript_48895/g.148789  ORF Transcript_48895/g.148789 Transcript_48895/m.148789 type:complete len:389 (+) Transcript_48895:6347-7513(+)